MNQQALMDAVLKIAEIVSDVVDAIFDGLQTTTDTHNHMFIRLRKLADDARQLENDLADLIEPDQAPPQPVEEP